MPDRPTTDLPIPHQPPPAFVLLFGGTFDPPHRGHVELPCRVRDELERRLQCMGQGWLVYVPAARSPHKERGPLVTDADRIELLRRSIADMPRTCVWTDEIDRALPAQSEPSYTIDTVRRAREWMDDHGMSATALRLLIGADQAVGFDRWRAPREIAHIAAPVVMVRGDVGGSEDLARRLRQTRYWNRDELESWRNGMIEVGRLDVSATRIRTALRDGDDRTLTAWLHPAALAYIRERGLYTAANEG